MKYELQLSIDKPRQEVWQFFRDPARMKDWQPFLNTVELIKGTAGQPGAESKLTFEEKGREYSLFERITACQQPERLDQTYENEFSVNTVQNSFLEQGQAQTLWITETEYKFKTLLMKMLGPVYKKNLVARTQRDMERFKEMIERDAPEPGAISQEKA